MDEIHVKLKELSTWNIIILVLMISNAANGFVTASRFNTGCGWLCAAISTYLYLGYKLKYEQEKNNKP